MFTGKMMDFGSNSVVAKSPNFMYFRLSPVNKMESVIGPTTRVERLMNVYDWLTYRNYIEEVTVGRVSVAKLYSKYNIENEFETMKVIQWENYFCDLINIEK